MVVLKEMVGLKVIRLFRGVIDFYYCRGIPCARSWPRKPKVERAPAVREGINVFIQAGKNLPLISNPVRDAYKAMAVGTRLTWKDVYYRGYISGTLKYYTAVDDLSESE